MEASLAWSDFLVRQSAKGPLNFTHGMRVNVPAGSACKMHNHRGIEIVYHPTGEGITRMQDGNRTLPFKAGYAIVYSPEERHNQVMNAKGEDFCTEFGAPENEDAVAPETGFAVCVEDTLLIEDLRMLSRGIIRSDPVGRSILNLRATACLLSLIQLALGGSQADVPPTSSLHVIKAEEFIHTHYDRIRSLGEVAAHVGISHDYLRHQFFALRKKTMVRYLNEIRVERAKMLLTHISNISLSQIAAMCGFKDEYYFSTVFRKITSQSPGRYRAAHR